MAELMGIVSLYVEFVKTLMPGESPFNNILTFVAGLNLTEAAKTELMSHRQESGRIPSRALVKVTSIEERCVFIVGPSISMSEVHHLNDFYMRFCKWCKRKARNSPFANIQTFYFGLNFSPDSVRTLTSIRRTEKDQELISSVEHYAQELESTRLYNERRALSEARHRASMIERERMLNNK